MFLRYLELIPVDWHNSTSHSATLFVLAIDCHTGQVPLILVVQLVGESVIV